MVLLMIINFSFTIFLIQYFFNIFLESKEWNKYSLIAILLIALSQIIMTFYQSATFNLTFNLILIALFCNLKYNGSKFTKIFFPIVFLMLTGTVEIALVYIFMSMDFDNLSDSQQFYGSIISKLMNFIVIYLIKVIKNNEKVYSSLYKVVVLLIPLSSLVITYFILNYPKETDIVSNLLMIILGVLVVTNMLLLIIYELIFREIKVKNEYGKFLQQFELKKEHNKQIETLSDNTRRLNHNIRNYFIAIHDFATKGDLDKIQSYVSDVLKEQISIKEISSSGMIAIDSIINFKNYEIENLFIKFKLNIDIPELTMFSESDLSVLLGCILDNAIESNKNVDIDSRFINLNITFSETYLIINCVNAKCQNILYKKSGLIKSTKTDKSNHGYGLISIRNICEKYDGKINLDYDANTFTTKCILIS